MKIMKQLRRFRDEINKRKKIKFVFFSFFLIIQDGCMQPLENKILGTWEIDHVSFSDGKIQRSLVDENTLW